MIINFEHLSNENKELFIKTMYELSNKFILQCQNNNLSTQYKNILKTILYFLQHLVKTAESVVSKLSLTTPLATTATTTTGDNKKKTKSKTTNSNTNTTNRKQSTIDFVWSEWRIPILKLFIDIASIKDTSKLWSMGLIPESFTAILWEYPLNILEKRPIGTAGHNSGEIGLRHLCVDLIGTTTSLFTSNLTSNGSFIALTTSLLNSLTTSDREYMSQYAADICVKSHPLLIKVYIYLYMYVYTIKYIVRIQSHEYHIIIYMSHYTIHVIY